MNAADARVLPALATTKVSRTVARVRQHRLATPGQRNYTTDAYIKGNGRDVP
jgi:hypothetical protein